MRGAKAGPRTRLDYKAKYTKCQDDGWEWSISSANGTMIATSFRIYKTKANCLNALENFIERMQGMRIYDIEYEKVSPIENNSSERKVAVDS